MRHLAPGILSIVATATALATQAVQVRFINTPDGADVVATANAGEYLLNIGDDHGVELPRACRNGLCGSCVCDVVEADGTVRTVRACTTSINAPADGAELVVDVYRLGGSNDDVMDASMKRFADNWEDEFVPDYKKGVTASSPPQGGGPDYSQPDSWTTYERLPEFNPRDHRHPRDAAAVPAATEGRQSSMPPGYAEPLADGLAPWERIW
mmetsp:Transcript_3348/g.8612  ORF Transcript_3348/g.8612 Transcript_3348/m.8612 type:complete len:210 (+) Transcript_3348:63-692(+)